MINPNLTKKIARLILMGLWLLVLSLTFSAIANFVRADTAVRPSAKQADYARAGWTADLSTLFHGVSGSAEIIDERTIRLHNFHYDGGGPAVYAYLGTEDSQTAFSAGRAIGPLLTRAQPYVDETVDLSLPPNSANLDGYTAISIWCVDFAINFGSGTFKGQVFLPLLIK